MHKECFAPLGVLISCLMGMLYTFLVSSLIYRPPLVCVGATALLLACKLGSLPMLELMFQNGADFEEGDDYERSALHYCVAYNCPDAAKFLIGKGSQKGVTDCHGVTPSMVARRHGADEEMIRLLEPELVAQASTRIQALPS